MQKIAAVDIDGVLNYYPQTWVDFVNRHLNEQFSDLYDIKANLPYAEYKALKAKYRTCGIKQVLTVRDGAQAFLDELHYKGYYIILITKRPIAEYNELLMQTTMWLKLSDLRYDFLYFSENKHLDIIQKFKGITFMIEDNRKNANEVAKQGYKVFLLDNEYNQGECHVNVERIKTLKDILFILNKEDSNNAVKQSVEAEEIPNANLLR